MPFVKQKNPDPTELLDLVEYERERAVVLDNTNALLAGKPAANILLTGDAGTGKSSTVKWLRQRFSERLAFLLILWYNKQTKSKRQKNAM